MKENSLCAVLGFVLLSLFALTPLSVCMPYESYAQVAQRTYFNNQYGISMLYPSYFVELGANPPSWIADFTTGYATVFLNVQQYPTFYNSFYQYFNDNVNSLRNQLASFQILPGWEGGRSATLANNPAFSIQFTYVASDGSPWEGWRIYTLSLGNVYSITYLSPIQYFANYLPDVDRMISSYSLTG